MQEYFLSANVNEILKIRASPRHEDDTLAWGPGKFGVFSIKSAYQEGGMSVFVRNLVYEVQTIAQSVAGATARAGPNASASVGAGAEAGTATGDGAPCRAVAGVDARSSV